MKNKIYLAGPFFNEQQIKREQLVSEGLSKNKTVNFVFRPKNIETSLEQNSNDWKEFIFNTDVSEIYNSDYVVAIANFIKENNEIVLDSGTCWEIGYAYAKNKPIVLITFDETTDSILNVMVDLGTNYHITCTEENAIEVISNIDFNHLDTQLKRLNWKTT